jgi:hypothetical protein
LESSLKDQNMFKLNNLGVFLERLNNENCKIVRSLEETLSFTIGFFKTITNDIFSCKIDCKQLTLFQWIACQIMVFTIQGICVLTIIFTTMF